MKLLKIEKSISELIGSANLAEITAPVIRKSIEAEESKINANIRAQAAILAFDQQISEANIALQKFICLSFVNSSMTS